MMLHAYNDRREVHHMFDDLPPRSRRRPHRNAIIVPSPDPDPFSTVGNAVMTALEYGIQNDGAMNDVELNILRELARRVSNAFR